MRFSEQFPDDFPFARDVSFAGLPYSRVQLSDPVEVSLQACRGMLNDAPNEAILAEV